MTVVARNAAGATFAVETRPKQARYRLEAPEGRYVVFAIARGTGDSSGKEPRGGAHTSYSICARDKARLMAGRCATGPLEEVMVTPARGREDVDIDDWYHARGARGDAGRSRTCSRNIPPTSTRRPRRARPTSRPRRVGADIERIQRAVTRGPFYAGRVAVARWPCGDVCEHWALVDIVTGRIVSARRHGAAAAAQRISLQEGRGARIQRGEPAAAGAPPRRRAGRDPRFRLVLRDDAPRRRWRERAERGGVLPGGGPQVTRG